MAFWSSFGHHGAVGEFEWVGSTGEGGDADGFQVLREGHLSMSTSVPGEGEGGSGAKETADGNAGNAAAQSLRKRNEAFIKVTVFAGTHNNRKPAMIESQTVCLYT